MPELPEVETVSRGLHRLVVGDTIEAIWLADYPEPLKSPAADIKAALRGARIAGVRRVAKHIVVDLARRNKIVSQWIVHLGMSGRLLVTREEDDLAKHTHAIASLKSGRQIRFVDPRRFGRLSVTAPGQEFAAAGKEPLLIKFDEFSRMFRGRSTPIKSALLNQKLLGGVGNIYADESLFRAGIRPRRWAANLTSANMRRLYDSLREVLREAIAAKGSSVSNYVNASGESGSFQFHHRVYRRTGQPCLRCKTAIKRIVIGGRSTHYCPHCQK